MLLLIKRRGWGGGAGAGAAGPGGGQSEGQQGGGQHHGAGSSGQAQHHAQQLPEGKASNEIETLKKNYHKDQCCGTGAGLFGWSRNR